MDHRYAAACSLVLVVACGKDGPDEDTNPFVTAAQTTVATSTLGGGDTGDDDTGEDDEEGSSSGDPVTGPPPLTESSDGETAVGDGSTGGSESGTTGAVEMVVEFDDCPTFDMATCGTHTQCIWSETGCMPNPAYCQAFDQAQCDLEVECVFGGVFVGQTCTVDCTALEQTTCPMVSGYCYSSDGSDGQLPGCYPFG